MSVQTTLDSEVIEMTSLGSKKIKIILRPLSLVNLITKRKAERCNQDDRFLMTHQLSTARPLSLSGSRRKRYDRGSSTSRNPHTHTHHATATNRGTKGTRNRPTKPCPWRILRDGSSGKQIPQRTKRASNARRKRGAGRGHGRLPFSGDRMTRETPPGLHRNSSVPSESGGNHNPRRSVGSA